MKAIKFMGRAMILRRRGIVKEQATSHARGRLWVSRRRETRHSLLEPKSIDISKRTIAYQGLLSLRKWWLRKKRVQGVDYLLLTLRSD